MLGRITSIEDVVRGGLCSGCGVCAYLQPALRLVDVVDEGLRPRRAPGTAAPPVREALAACPGVGLEHDFDRRDPLWIQELLNAWGPVRAMWEGFAADERLRFAASSGGAASALAAYALEVQGFEGVLHSAARADARHLNETVLSRSRGELLGRTGSRYAPASPADGLRSIEEAGGPCLFIGKPCDVAAAQRARALRPDLDRNLGLTIAFFCAGTPSTRGTLRLLESMGVTDPSALLELRYRGNGWPGKVTATVRDAGGGRSTRELGYEEAWGGVLSRHVQWRCRLCVDHTGEFADVAVGDPWYRDIAPGEAGSSLILARTERGEALVEAALGSGYLRASRAPPRLLEASQPNLLRARAAAWGRVAALRAIGARAPIYRRLPSLHLWLTRLDWKEKAESVVGAVLRCLRRGLHPLQRAGEIAGEAADAPDTEAARPRLR